MPKYPAQIDNSQSLPTAVDNLTPVQGAIFNKLRDAVLAVESELGVKPSGSYTTVRARLDALEGVVGNLRIIELAKDLGGTLEDPKVIGFQGRPISTVSPHVGDVYVWNGIAWTPQAQSGGGGGGFSPPPGTIPGQTLVWDGAEYLPELYLTDDLVEPYEIDLVGTEFVEVGQTIVNPAFTATYTETPSAATLTDDVFNTPQDVTSTPTAFNSSHSFIKSAFDDKVTFTLTATQDNHVTKTSAWDIVWGQKTYYGTSTPGQTGEAFIKTLIGQVVTDDKNIGFSINASAGQKIYFACRSAYGDIVFTIHDIEGGFTRTQTGVSVTNDFGFTENYDLYESDYAGLGDLVVFAGDGDDLLINDGGPIGPPGPPGPSGSNTIIYRNSAATSAPVYGTWAGAVSAALVASSSGGSVTILVDNSLMTGDVPSGTWDFGDNTVLAGIESQYKPTLTIQNGAVFTNSPVAYKNIEISTSNGAAIVSSVPAFFDLHLEDAEFSNGGVAPIYMVTNSMIIRSYGQTICSGGAPIFQTAGNLAFYAHDATQVGQLMLSAATYTAKMFSGAARIDPTQFGGTFTIDISSVDADLDIWGQGSFGPTSSRPTPSFSQPGFRFFDTTLNTLVIWDGSTWITVGGGGTLAGDVTGPAGTNVVETISGNAGNVNIAASTQTSTANLNFQPFSAQAQFTATGAFEAIYNNYTIPANTGVQVDVIIVVTGNSGTDFASWKLSFGAQRVGIAGAVTVGSNPSGSGVIPDRNTTGAAAWLATVILSGNTVQVKGQAVSGAVWGISFQALPINP